MTAEGTDGTAELTGGHDALHIRQLLHETVNETVQRARRAVDDAGAHGIHRGAGDHPLRRRHLDGGQQGGAGRQGIQ